jgi:hypothetical protein
MRDDPELLVPLFEVQPRPAPPAPATGWRSVAFRLWLVVGLVCVAPFAYFALAGPERGVMAQMALAGAAVWAVVLWIVAPLSSRDEQR